MASELPAEVQKKIIAVIRAILPEVSIYLFGSRARGTNAPFADIDLALDTGKPLDINTLCEVKNLMHALDIQYKVDVIDFQSADPSFKEEIEKDKVLWTS